MIQLKHSLVVGMVVWSVALGSVEAEVKHRQLNAYEQIVEVSNDSWQPEGFENGIVIPASYLYGEIVIDGKGDDRAWQQVTEIEVPLSYGSTQKAFLKALYNDHDVIIQVRWADDTEDREYHPWIWDSERNIFVEGPQVDDSLLLSFEAGCEWTPSLLAGYIFDFDAWHWLAARSDPLGQALDLYGNVQDQAMGDPNYVQVQRRVDEDDWIMKFTDNTGVALYAEWDEIDRVYMRQTATDTLFIKTVPDNDGRHTPPSLERVAAPSTRPADKSQSFPQFSPVNLPAGADEVSARGHWENGFWTVEFRRARITPAKTLNDAVFQRLTQFSVHVFDRTERIDQVSESKRLFLQFLPIGQKLVSN